MRLLSGGVGRKLNCDKTRQTMYILRLLRVGVQARCTDEGKHFESDNTIYKLKFYCHIQKRGPKNSYISVLENRVKGLENLLNKTDASMSSVLGQPGSMTPSDHSSPETLNSQHAALSPSSSTEEDEDEDLVHIQITEQLKRFSMSPVQGRFFGPASSFALMRTAHGAKKDITGRDDFNPVHHFRRPYFWQSPPVSDLPHRTKYLLTYVRVYQWEQALESTDIPPYDFPENSLLNSLISLYFEKVNSYFPALHEPTFRRNVGRGLHFNDRQFAAVVLAVCALGGRFSDDERALYIPGHSLSAGWKWFEQIHPLRHPQSFDPPSLYELQYYCLATQYMFGISSPSFSWNVNGAGIRRAVEMGAHRRMPDGHKPTVDEEQTKRCFWFVRSSPALPLKLNLAFAFDRILVTFDRLHCNFLGRPSAIRDEDFDLELPSDCDDEYWENADPEKAYKQPPGQPSRVSFFIAIIRLSEILAFVLRTMFSLKKSQLVMGLITDSWEQKALIELDSALNEWKSKLPQHLEWKPDDEVGLFFDQSAFIHALFFVVQIQGHRRFVRTSSPMSFSSLAICMNATKSCVNVLDTLSQRSVVVSPLIGFFGYYAGLLLLTNVWASKRAGISMDYKRASNDTKRLLRVLQSCENRWMIAGKFGDLLYELSKGIDECTDSNQSMGATFFPDQPVGRENPSNSSDNDSPFVAIQTASFSNGPPAFQNTQFPLENGAGRLSSQSPLDPLQMNSVQTGNTMGFQQQEDLGMNTWTMSDLRGMGFEFDDWNTYAANVSTLDLDAFMQNNPEIFQ
ncbi:Gypsy retrotransposon integrase-like protein 1 [Marasmius crinis-equi]|uniref:Gypsy retrotransposon integrase-like protein 1 n=1 Tax=Marasmius crinis-equi TaxID=585013 RepID=A0ABR3FUH7_9AGAR